MRIHHEHQWEVSVSEARAIQQSLRQCVVMEDRLGSVCRVGGVDVGFDKRRGLTRAAVAILQFPGLEPLEKSVTVCPTRFPYVPGYLSFREVPAILQALASLRRRPDLLLCDGQGFAHPRRFGLACHLGVLTDLPSIGVAKTRLIGSHEKVPDERGAWTDLTHGEEVIGAVLRTRVGVKPLFISVGHRITLPTACEYVMRCTTRFRLPETTRRADKLASGR